MDSNPNSCDQEKLSFPLLPLSLPTSPISHSSLILITLSALYPPQSPTSLLATFPRISGQPSTTPFHPFLPSSRTSPCPLTSTNQWTIYLPPSHLSFGCMFNHPVDHLPTSLLYLSFTKHDISQPLDYCRHAALSLFPLLSLFKVNSTCPSTTSLLSSLTSP